MANIEDVFRLSGIPTHTFVQPDRYDEILVSVRTPGRCLVLEGPSGIGKTTTITKVLDELSLGDKVINLSARQPEEAEFIAALPDMKDIGTVIVDDFHRLDGETKERLSDYMKVLADRESVGSKLILIGINKAGQQLVQFAHDLGLRLDVFRLESNPDELIEKMIRQGEEALNVSISSISDVAERSHGSFQIAQLLCHKLCILDKIRSTVDGDAKVVKTSINVAVEDVMTDLSRQFRLAAKTFASGSRLRREGRAPYLHILRWLSEGDEWSLDLTEAMNDHPEMKGSIGQVIDKGWLSALLNDKEKKDILQPYFHFEESTRVLSVEDPKFIFYLKNIGWRSFSKSVGYKADYFGSRYDFALSFAGANRSLADKLHKKLVDREIACFYDFEEQHRILAQNVEDYLAPIYRSEARYIIVILSSDYPKRIWTKFESDIFKERFGEGSVIPIRFGDFEPGYFDDVSKYGSVPFDPAQNEDEQVDLIVDLLSKRLIEDRDAARDAENAETISVDVAVEAEPVQPSL